MSAPERAGKDRSGGPEWFDAPDPDTGEVGLRFGCTQCGNCCSGPPGYVGFTPAEAGAIAARLGLSEEQFLARYTQDTPRGRSIRDDRTDDGWDCVFLDRTSQPGRALCAIYEVRPAQCRSWPFWPELLRSRRDWVRVKARCPGLDRGRLFTPVQIRVIRGAPARC